MVNRMNKSLLILTLAVLACPTALAEASEPQLRFTRCPNYWPAAQKALVVNHQLVSYTDRQGQRRFMFVPTEFRHSTGGQR